MIPTSSKDDPEATSLDTIHHTASPHTSTMISTPIEPIRASDLLTPFDNLSTVTHIPVTTIDPIMLKAEPEPSSSIDVPMEIDAKEVLEEPVSVVTELLNASVHKKFKKKWYKGKV
jgi:hypothetical protein